MVEKQIVFGHDWAIDFLRQTMSNHRNRHAYLITGTNQIGKHQLAMWFTMALNCEHEDESLRPCLECNSCKRIFSGNHPDIIFGELDDKGVLKIEAMRDVMRLLALKPFSSRYRIAVLEEFDNTRPQAQDAILKTLEEPPNHAVIILLAQSTEKVLATITSRCQIIPLRPVPQEQVKGFLEMHGADEERASLLARLSSGRIGWALSALRDEVIMQERDDMLDMLNDALNNGRIRRFEIAEELDKIARKDQLAMRYLLETWQTYWRDVLLEAQQSRIKPCNSDRLTHIQQLVQRITPDDALKALKATRHAMNTIQRTNANARMVLEVMFLDYPLLQH